MYQLLLLIVAGLTCTAAIPVVIAACGRLPVPASPATASDARRCPIRLTVGRRLDRRLGRGAATGTCAVALGAAACVLNLYVDTVGPGAGISWIVSNLLWTALSQASVIVVPATVAVEIVAATRGPSGRVLAIVAAALVAASLFV